MKCPNCGNELSDTAKFCTSCGTSIPEAAPAAEAQPAVEPEAPAAEPEAAPAPEAPAAEAPAEAPAAE